MAVLAQFPISGSLATQGERKINPQFRPSPSTIVTAVSATWLNPVLRVYASKAVLNTAALLNAANYVITPLAAQPALTVLSVAYGTTYVDLTLSTTPPASGDYELTVAADTFEATNTLNNAMTVIPWMREAAAGGASSLFNTGFD